MVRKNTTAPKTFVNLGEEGYDLERTIALNILTNVPFTWKGQPVSLKQKQAFLKQFTNDIMLRYFGWEKEPSFIKNDLSQMREEESNLGNASREDLQPVSNGNMENEQEK